MPPEESLYPDDWFRVAEKDLKRVERALASGEPDIELAAFYLQQSVEKLLKGFLLSKGWTLRRIHDLEALLDDAKAHDPDLEKLRPLLQTITKYYLVERYPLSADSDVTEGEVRESLVVVQDLFERLHRK